MVSEEQLKFIDAVWINPNAENECYIGVFVKDSELREVVFRLNPTGKAVIVPDANIVELAKLPSVRVKMVNPF